MGGREGGRNGGREGGMEGRVECNLCKEGRGKRVEGRGKTAERGVRREITKFPSNYKSYISR
jgi:hypothetical protein